MAEKILHLELTETEAYNLVNFVEENLIDVIRVDTDIDSFDWIRDLVNAYQKIAEVIHNG
jgi:hypothetical protein